MCSIIENSIIPLIRDSTLTNLTSLYGGQHALNNSLTLSQPKKEKEKEKEIPPLLAKETLIQ